MDSYSLSIVLSLVAIFLLLMTALMTLVGISDSHQPAIATMTHSALYLTFAESVSFAVLALWAILTVFGILRLRSWGRYSILIIGGGLAAIGVLAAAFSILFARTMLPALQAQQPAADPHIMSFVLLFAATVYLLIAGVGIWWLIYFNLSSTREIFSNPAVLSQSQSNTESSFSSTPAAIKIIGGLLLFSAVCCLLGVLMPFPVFLLGFILAPVVAHVVYIGFAALAVWMGYGLLRLKESARLLTIAFIIFGCCNILLATLPWYRNQFCLYMTQLASYMPTLSGQPQVFFNYSMALVLISCAWSLIVYALVLWLLHRHRSAFHTPTPPPKPMLVA